MKVLLTALWPVGGIRTYFRQVYAHSAFEGFRFVLVAPDDGLRAHLDRYLPKGRLELVPVAESKKKLFWGIRNVLARERFDLIHSHGFTAGLVTAMARLRQPSPHVLTAHDVILPNMFAGPTGQLRKLLIQAVFRRLDAIHAVSEDGGANLQEQFPRIPLARIRPILHGIECDEFRSASRRDVRAELMLPQQALIFGFFGRFMAQKGFRTLVDAVYMIRNDGMTERPVKVLTFGWGGFIREDYSYVASLGLQDNFIQLPETDDPGSWMKGLDVVAMPSRWEACGLVGMEALCAGAPIVGTNCIGLREVLGGSPARMVDPEDPAALARALIETADPKNRAVFEAYQPQAAKRFSIDRAAGELRALYHELVGQAS